MKPTTRSLIRFTGVKESVRAFGTPTIPRARSKQQGIIRQIQHRNYAEVVVQHNARGRTRRIATTVAVGLAMFGFGGYLALSFAPPFITSLILGRIPSDAESLKFEAPDNWTQQVNDNIINSRLAQLLRASGAYTESRPHQKYPKEVKQHNLTASTLMTKDTVPVPPLYFMKKDGSSMVSIYYVGTHVSGHPGVVHGGFLATMLDEGLATCAFQSLPNKVGVTAQLNIAYKKPTAAAQYLVLFATTEKAEGRKVWTNGAISELEDFTKSFEASQPCASLVEASALFIEPRHAKVSKFCAWRLSANISTVSQESLSTSRLSGTGTV